MFGVLLYEQFFKLVEVRWLFFWSVIVNIIRAFFNYALAMRWNLACNINDLAFIIFNAIVFDSLLTAFKSIPLLSLFAQVCPKRIEGTIYAFLSGVSNLDWAVI